VDELTSDLGGLIGSLESSMSAMTDVIGGWDKGVGSSGDGAVLTAILNVWVWLCCGRVDGVGSIYVINE
jgi:hypothetical protein